MRNQQGFENGSNLNLAEFLLQNEKGLVLKKNYAAEKLGRTHLLPTQGTWAEPNRHSCGGKKMEAAGLGHCPKGPFCQSVRNRQKWVD